MRHDLSSPEFETRRGPARWTTTGEAAKDGQTDLLLGVAGLHATPPYQESSRGVEIECADFQSMRPRFPRIISNDDNDDGDDDDDHDEDGDDDVP